MKAKHPEKYNGYNIYSDLYINVSNTTEAFFR